MESESITYVPFPLHGPATVCTRTHRNSFSIVFSPADRGTFTYIIMNED